jgi:hypothetical protein
LVLGRGRPGGGFVAALEEIGDRLADGEQLAGPGFQGVLVGEDGLVDLLVDADDPA